MRGTRKPVSGGPHLSCQACGKKRLTTLKRGVCGACYIAAFRAIAAGKTTWEELEDTGVVSPRSSGGRKSAFSAAAEQKLGRKL